MFSIVFSLCLAMAASAQTASPTSLRGVLLEQLQTTHNNKQWFAPASAAVEGITAEQASWQDGKGNHSLGQLAAHLVFWNRQQLAKFRGEAPEAFSGDNNETFNRFDAARWTAIVHDLDEVMTAWEEAVEGADEKNLEEWASTIAHIGAHNAYHVGQMIYIRKLQGSWNSENGVK